LIKWNEYGLDGLNHTKGGGKPSFLIEKELKEVDEFIKHNSSLGTKDVHYFILKNFNIDYSLKQVRFIINKLEYGWIKPFPIFYDSPKNAKEILKNETSQIDPDNDIYGFFDESCFKNQTNISRVLKRKS
jgi:transposase